MGQPSLFCLCLAVSDLLPLDQMKSEESWTLNVPPPAPSTTTAAATTTLRLFCAQFNKKSQNLVGE